MKVVLSTLCFAALVGCGADSLAPTSDTQLATSTPALASSGNPGIAPVNSHAGGKSNQEWAGAMLQWISAIPYATNPLVDQTGALTQNAQSGKVWFLPGPSQFAAQPQNLAITMSTGTSIFFSPLTYFGGGPGVPGFGDDTPAELRGFVESLLSSITGVQVEIDGVPVSNINQYWVVSADKPLTVPADNIYLATPITFGVSGGFGLFLNPMPPGVHTLHAVSAVPDFGLAFDITYRITVKPGK